MKTIKSKLIAKGIAVDMYVGICDFEYKAPQRVIVNVSATGTVPLQVKTIADCLDYSKVCDYVASWAQRPHVELVETLALEVFHFMFKDPRIEDVHVEILKPQVMKNADFVGVSQRLTRSEYMLSIDDDKLDDGGW